MNKNSLREYFLKKRNEIKDIKLEERIIKNLLNSKWYKNSDSIFLTVPFRNEIDTVPIIKKSLETGKRVFLPKTIIEEKRIIPVEIFQFPKGLIKGAYGILEPKNKTDVEKVPELSIVPALAFSIDGYRIGYGGGYYDRYLENNNTFKIGLSYNELIVSKLPLNSTDIPVDCIITPDYLIQTNRNLAQNAF